MALTSLRALVWGINRAVHGVDVTVTPAGGVAVQTRGIWLAPVSADYPEGRAGWRRGELRRREAPMVLALGKDAVPTLPAGSVIVAPEDEGGTPVTWRVDGVEHIGVDHTRYVLVRTE